LSWPAHCFFYPWVAARGPEPSSIRTRENTPLNGEHLLYTGAAAKGAASSTTGFSACKECHNTDFSGGISNTTCLNTTGCHGAGINAPHAPAPWRGGTWTHVNTDQSNAPVCAQCHTNGANSSIKPSPFDQGAAPGCFNNTLCHATASSGHPAGWALPTAHGATAQSAPSSSAGFSLCQTCHGNDFTGGNALTSCLNTAGCHGAGINARTRRNHGEAAPIPIRQRIREMLPSVRCAIRMARTLRYSLHRRLRREQPLAASITLSATRRRPAEPVMGSRPMALFPRTLPDSTRLISLYRQSSSAPRAIQGRALEPRYTKTAAAM